MYLADIAQEKKPEEESIQQGDMPVSTKRGEYKQMAGQFKVVDFMVGLLAP